MAAVLDAPPFAGRAVIERTRIFAPRLGLGIVVAVPVRDEEERLETSLLALERAASLAPEPCGVVLVINNTCDRSARVAWDWAERSGLPVLCCEMQFAPGIADAAHARRAALDLAEGVARRDAVLLTTDADTVVSARWIARLVQRVRGGAAIVGGMIDPHPDELQALPPSVRHAASVERALFLRYETLWDRIAPGEPCPLLAPIGGASMAICAAAYRDTGRLPTDTANEDRALASSIMRRGGAVAMDRSAPAVTSCRLVARAEHGMAETLAERCQAADPVLDPLLTPVDVFLLRALAWRSVAATCGRVNGSGATQDRLSLELERKEVVSAQTLREGGASMREGLLAIDPSWRLRLSQAVAQARFADKVESYLGVQHGAGPLADRATAVLDALDAARRA